MRNNRIPKKIGLALGGGGAKGLAHIGVIKALKRAGIPIDFISGTSMGALVGGWYAATEDIAFLEDLFLKFKTSQIFPVREILHRKSGAIFRGDSLGKSLATHFGAMRVENCKIPFRAVATDVKNGDEVIIKKGKLADAVRASVALPIVFNPVKLDNRLLMDGGFSNPVPADVVREMGAEFVIAVDVSSKWISFPDETFEADNIFAMISNALSVIEYQLAKNVLKGAHVVLRPPVLDCGWLEFGRAPDIIRRGLDEVNLVLKNIRKGAGLIEPPRTLGEKFFDFLLNP